MRTSGDSPQRIREPWGERTPYGAGEKWPARVDTHLGDVLTDGQELLRLAEECRAQTLRQVTWAETKLKETAARALVTP